MHKILSSILFMLFAYGAIGQVMGIVDKKTKEFSVPPNQKIEYRVYGYQYPNITTVKMICFSSHEGDVRDNYSGCRLGSYYDTDRMKPGDKILYLGGVGTFGKMTYISRDGTKTLFYLPKSSFKIK